MADVPELRKQTPTSLHKRLLMKSELEDSVLLKAEITIQVGEMNRTEQRRTD